MRRLTLNQAACLAVIRFECRVVIGGLGDIEETCKIIIYSRDVHHAVHGGVPSSVLVRNMIMPRC